MEYLWNETDFRNNLRRLIQIHSVTGDCGTVSKEAVLGKGIYQSLDFMLSLGDAFGFQTRMLDGMCGWIEMGEGEQLIGILCHLDTVSVSADGWDTDPFDCVERDGKLYGRGVCDNKGPAMAALYAMKAVADAGVPLNKRVRLILGGDEESGDWKCMERYRQTEEIPAMSFTPDADYPAAFAEKGILKIALTASLTEAAEPLFFRGGSQINIVPDYAEAVWRGKRYEARGVPAHAMDPSKGVNAFYKLAEQLRAEGCIHPFVELIGIATAEGLDIALSDEPSGSLTVNPSIAAVDAAQAVLKCDIRHPVTIPSEEVMARLSAAIAPLGFTASIQQYLPPLYSPKDSHLVSTLQRVYFEQTGDASEPVALGGGTYARAFPNAVAFGIRFPGEPEVCHIDNEYWALDSIRKNIQIMANAIAAL